MQFIERIIIIIIIIIIITGIIIHNREDALTRILLVHVFWNEKGIYCGMFSHFISSAFRVYPNTHSGSDAGWPNAS